MTNDKKPLNPHTLYTGENDHTHHFASLFLLSEGSWVNAVDHPLLDPTAQNQPRHRRHLHLGVEHPEINLFRYYEYNPDIPYRMDEERVTARALKRLFPVCRYWQVFYTCGPWGYAGNPREAESPDFTELPRELIPQHLLDAEAKKQLDFFNPQLTFRYHRP